MSFVCKAIQDDLFSKSSLMIEGKEIYCHSKSIIIKGVTIVHFANNNMLYPILRNAFAILTYSKTLAYYR